MATSRRMSSSGRSSDADTGADDTVYDDPVAKAVRDDAGRDRAKKSGGANVTTTHKKEAIEGLQRSPTTSPFNDFWAAFEPFVRAICRDKGLYAQEEDDVVSNVKLDVLSQITRYEQGKGRFHAWLGTITRHKAMDVLRDRIPREKRVVSYGTDPEILLSSKGHSAIAGSTGSNETPASAVTNTTKAAVKTVSDTEMARLHGKLRKGAGPATLVCIDEEREIAKSLLERVAAQVSPTQWQIFESATIREIDVAKVCKALEVTENQVYIARNRVGKIYNEELEAMGRTIGRDLGKYLTQRVERPKAPGKAKTSRSAK